MAPVRRRTNQYGFFPAAGTDYRSGVEPQLAARLNRLGKALRLHLIGVSGARTPAHSVEVGGFANDPHTRGQASDTPGIESVPETVLRRFGLTRPFPGAQEADHIQLLGGARGSTRSMARPGGYSIADLWTQAGGPRNLAPIMSAIAMAESGGRVDAVSPQNDDGSYDYGLFQVNSSHSQFDVHKLVTDPLYNARAAVSIWHTQGLHAWSTYNNGAYRTYLGGAGRARTKYGGTRPGGTVEDPGAEVDSIFADYVNEGGTSGNAENVGLLDPLFGPLNPLGGGVPSPFNPVKPFTEGAKAIKDVGDFLRWISWIFHPRNVLRAVEFLTGASLMILGIVTAIQVHKDAKGETAVGRAQSRTRRAAGNVIAATPAGRTIREARGVRAGRRAARSQGRRVEFESAYQRGRKGEGRKGKTRRNEREMDRKYGGVPF